MPNSKNKKTKKTIAICSSVSFYKDVLEIEKQLKQQGFSVLIPTTARKMQKSGNFDDMQYKTWYQDETQYHIKKHLMDEHFKKIKKSDAILVVNMEKKKIQGYIGGNVLMEITAAYLWKKPIYIWNTIDATHPFLEELKGVQAIFLNQDLASISLR
jgi:hypothetical protein